MATTREVRRGAFRLRLHQFVLLRSRRNIRSTIGDVKLSSEQHRADSRCHESGHQSHLRRISVTHPCKRSLAELHLLVEVFDRDEMRLGSFVVKEAGQPRVLCHRRRGGIRLQLVSELLLQTLDPVAVETHDPPKHMDVIRR